MPEPVNETGVVRAIVKQVKKRWPRAWTLKVHGGMMQESGVPDLVMCIEGRFIGLEVKHQKPGESAAHAYQRTSASQRKQIDEIKLAGGLSDTVLSADEAVELIETHLEELSERDSTEIQ